MKEEALSTGDQHTGLLFRFDALIHRAFAPIRDKIEIMFARRHPDTHEEVDYELRLRELEGHLERDNRGFRMGNYNEKEKHSWKDWILGLVGLLIVAWLGKISLQMDELTKVVVRQEQDEQRLNRIEQHIFRGTP
jgi:hypothetical protein